MPKVPPNKRATNAPVNRDRVTLINPSVISVPEALRRHPRVVGQCFYVLPLQLCKSLFKIIGKDRFNPADVELETELATIAERRGGCVGFRDGLPMQDALLKTAPFNSTVLEYLSQASATRDVKALSRQLDSRSRRARTAQCGFLGWLLTHSQFLEELSELMRVCPEIAASPSLPPQPITFPFGNQAVPSLFQMDTTSNPAAIAMREFCQRWRLQSITGPQTMLPLGVQFPVMLPAMSAAHAEHSGALLYIPDIVPLPNREELRLMLEDSARSTAATADHLSEWIELVRADTQGKKSIEKFARWYVVQHYMRVLYSRHGDRLHRCGRKIEVVLSQGLRISSDAIHRDLLAMKKRLGPNWFLS